MGNFLIRILVGVGIDLFVVLAALIYLLASEPLWIKPLQQFSDESLTDRVNLLREHGLPECDKLQAIMFGACPEPLAGLAELLEPKSGQRSSRIFLWSEDETTSKSL